MLERMRGFFNKDAAKKVWYFGFLIALGVMLMFLGSRTDREGAPGDAGETNKKANTAQSPELIPLADVSAPNSQGYEQALEEKLEQTLSAVDGVGAVRVMITVSERDAVELAKDITAEKRSVSGEDAQTEKNEMRHVTVTSGAGQTSAVITKRYEPRIEGVVIVAEGGGSAEVKTALTKAAEALLNLPAHKIEVLKLDAANK